MSKQFTFCADDNDDILFLEVIKKVFPNPYFIGDELQMGNHILDKIEINPTLFTDKKYLDDLKYFEYQDCGGDIENVLDKYESPVIEYTKSVKRVESGAEFYGFGRFYCAFSKDKEFSKEVGNLFRLLKKEFYYFKEHSLYVSKNIDLDTAFFYLKKEYRQLIVL